MFVREKSIAFLAAFGFAESSATSIRPKAIFWFGHMTNQTLKAIIRPNHMAIPNKALVVLPSVSPIERTEPKYPSIQARISPQRTVDAALQRHQNNTAGAICFPIAGFRVE